MDFIEWSWTPVEDVSGYDVQFSANEAFTDEDEIIARTAEEISYRKDGLEAGTSAYLRVRSATGADDDRVTSDWSTHVTGMTMEAPPPPEPPATPTGLMVSDTTETSITWTWNAVEGATGYVVQASTDEMFDATETVLFDGMPYTTDTSFTAADLEADTTLYVRVAAAAGTVEAPLVSAFTTHVTGMTMAATLAAPANVRVKSKGANFIEWEWDEVEGADGYQAHFSTDSGFSDPNPFEIRGASSTTQRVANLDAESDGYFRVRAYAGTVTDRMFGDWSEADMATTEEPPPPPPAEPLDAPENVGTSDRQDNSITVTWDDVDGAEEYQVQQSEAGGSFEDANCGSATGSSIVTDEECVASGLDERTAYRFQVRAIPDSADTTSTASAWSDPTASVETTGVAPPPPVTGGDDELNVQWTSTAETTSGSDASITWNWDPVGNRDDRARIEHLVHVTSSSTCGSVTYSAPAPPISTTLAADSTANSWTNLGRNISVTRSALDNGEVRRLCVVRTWEEDLGNGVMTQRFGTPSVLLASTSPAPPANAAGSPSVNRSARQTTALSWTFNVDSGFQYEVRALTVSGDIDRAANRPSVDTCDAGDSRAGPASSSHDNVPVTHRENSPQPHTHYDLCVRVKNDGQGMSDWVVTAASQTTLPGAPNVPRYQGPPVSDVQNHVSGSQIVRRLVWSVGETDGTPRDQTDYVFKIVVSEESSVPRTIVDDVCDATDHADYPAVANNRARRNAPGGIEIEVMLSGADDTAADLIGTTGSGEPDEYYFFACVRAEPDTTDGTPNTANTDHGPWAISGATRFSRTLPNPGGVRITESNGAYSITWNRVAGAAGYQVRGGSTTSQYDFTNSGNDCSTSTAADTSCTITTTPSAGETFYYWVTATATVGGSSLVSRPSSRAQISN